MDQYFKGTIWTNHALQRLQERGISQGDAWATLVHPQESRKGSNKDAYVFYRTYGSEKIEVVASQNDKKEWVVLSVWSRPSYQTASKHPKAFFLEELVEKILQKLFGKIRKND
jgi:hypothetical protein